MWWWMLSIVRVIVLEWFARCAAIGCKILIAARWLSFAFGNPLSELPADEHICYTPNKQRKHEHGSLQIIIHEKIYLINGIAIKNLLGASPSLDFGVISFLWQGSLSTGNHSMFYQESKEQRSTIRALYNQIHVLLYSIQMHTYPYLFSGLGVELGVFRNSWYDVQSNQLI